MIMENVSDPPLPRKRGRPAKLSREKIIEAAVNLLSDVPLTTFSLALLAKNLRVGVMTLYTYFPSRDDILIAVADHIYTQFETPSDNDNWREQVLSWMWATVSLFDRYPVAIKLSTWDGHISPAWLRTWFPIVRILKKQQPNREVFAYAVSWFSNISMGFITAQMASPQNRKADAIVNIGVLEITDRQLAAELWLDFETIDRDTSLAFGFDVLIGGLERLLAKNSLDEGEDR